MDIQANWYNLYMLKFAFNKLIRDKIVDQQLAAGSKPKYRRLDKDEHVRCLIEKIVEESQEFSADPKQAVQELADLQQIIDDLKELLGISGEEVVREQKRKNDKAGPFKKGIYEEYVEVDEANEWVAYYRQNPDRYPEIK
jgi:predicted house-cleaning noncanonical NTP pyrophosphatase (MazG superfamily)